MADRRHGQGEGAGCGRAVLRVARGLALGFGLGASTLAALACPQPGDVFDAWIVAAGPGGAPAIALRQHAPSTANVASSIWNRPLVALLLASAAGTMEPQTLPQRLADSGPPRSSEVSVAAVATPASPCASLLLHAKRAGVPSALVHFDARGVVADVQSLTAQTLGFDPARYEWSVTAPGADADADGNDNGNGNGAPTLVVSEGDAARGALARRPDGVYAMDPAASAVAVWNSFLKAANSGDAKLAVAHLANGARNRLAHDLLAAGPGIAALARDVVYVGADYVADEIVAVQTVVRITSESHRVFEQQIMRHEGLWFVE
ncbi:MAG: hypothetical protein JWP60_4714 [Ramlibacter sp.]|nr:hypothetical protein [Ramlibacter sp.]